MATMVVLWFEKDAEPAELLAKYNPRYVASKQIAWDKLKDTLAPHFPQQLVLDMADDMGRQIAEAVTGRPVLNRIRATAREVT